MGRRLNKLGRDVWNLWGCHFPSRRVRRWLLRRILGGFGPGASVLMHVQVLQPDNVFLGARAVVNQHCILDGRDYPVRIGEDVDIAMHTHIWTLQHDPHDDAHGTSGGPVTVADHVWIAARATILPGVTVGRGAVVAAGAVVTHDVPSMSIVAGVPAKVVGRRRNRLTYKLDHAPRLR